MATEDALNSIAAEMGIGRSDLIQNALREWLETIMPICLFRSSTRIVKRTEGRRRGLAFLAYFPAQLCWPASCAIRRSLIRTRNSKKELMN